MDDRQGTDVSRLIGAGRTIPIHYDDYKVMKSPLTRFLDRSRGETIDLPTHARPTT